MASRPPPSTSQTKRFEEKREVILNSAATVFNERGVRDLSRARADVFAGISATLDHAKQVGMPLAIEPLHPMYAADRACVNTMELLHGSAHTDSTRQPARGNAGKNRC
jgi:hypothetical protein